MDKPNIILIMTDQHRMDSLGCYGNKVCQTPNFDELAKDGVVFTNAYTTNPVCTPARSSIQTGLYPSKNGMETNIYCPGCRVNELIDSSRLLSRRLEDIGYSIGYTGKWHLGIGKDKKNDYEYKAHYSNNNICSSNYLDSEGTLPTDVGYEGDDFPGHGEGGYRYNQYKEYLKENGLEFIVEGYDKPANGYTDFGKVTSPIESTNEYYLVERTIKYLEEFKDRDKPFYFQLNFWGPHNPHYAPEKYLKLYENESFEPWISFDEDLVNKPKIHNRLRRFDIGWDVFEKSLKHYYAFVTSIDAQIGRLIEYLKKNDLYDNTVIIFLPDHGDSHGCHKGLENKSYHMYEETTHIPLIIKPMSDWQFSSKVESFVNTCDIYSTILDIAGSIEEGSDSDGSSLLPFLQGKKTEAWTDCVVTEGLGVSGVLETQRMLRKKNMKYVFHTADIDELYDLEEDPYEMNNLIYNKEYSKKLMDMKKSLYDWMDNHNDFIIKDFKKLANI